MPTVDLDTVPKTEKLNTHVISTRPKVPHNPPSRSHIVSNCIIMYLCSNYSLLHLKLGKCFQYNYNNNNIF